MSQDRTDGDQDKKYIFHLLMTSIRFHFLSCFVCSAFCVLFPLGKVSLTMFLVLCVLDMKMMIEKNYDND